MSITVFALVCSIAWAKHLTIVSYNDVYELNPIGVAKRGGASRVSQLIKDLKKEDPDTLVLFSGDTLSPSVWSTVFRGQHMIDAHNELQCDFACLGNHEFDFDLPTFEQASIQSNFPWLNANAYEIGNNQLLRNTIPNAIVSKNGISIGLFGIMYNMKDNSTGVYFTDPIEQAQYQVDELKARGAEFIIALTHQHWTHDNALASTVDGIDLIFGGHDHKAMMQTDFKTPYVKAEMDFINIWVTRVEFSAENEIDTSFQNIPIVYRMPTDPRMDALIGKYEKQIGVRFNITLGASCTQLDLSQPLVRSKEAPIGNFIAEATRRAYHQVADVGFINGGAIRTGQVYPAGRISFNDVMSWCPFGNKVFMVQMSGATLKRYIDYDMKHSCGVGKEVIQNGFLVHLSGMRYVYQCHAQNQGSVVSLQWAESRQEVSDRQSIVVTMSNFSYEKALYDDILENTQLIIGDKDGMTIAVAVRNEVERVSVVCPTVDGRIQILRHNTE